MSAYEIVSVVLSVLATLTASAALWLQYRKRAQVHFLPVQLEGKLSSEGIDFELRARYDNSGDYGAQITKQGLYLEIPVQEGKTIVEQFYPEASPLYVAPKTNAEVLMRLSSKWESYGYYEGSVVVPYERDLRGTRFRFVANLATMNGGAISPIVPVSVMLRYPSLEFELSDSARPMDLIFARQRPGPIQGLDVAVSDEEGNVLFESGQRQTESTE
jgi:hypothetical protein